MRQEFAAAIAMAGAIQAIMQNATLAFSEKQHRISLLGPLRHRGKGRGAPSRNYGNAPHNTPHQGKRECARRVRQMASGFIGG